MLPGMLLSAFTAVAAAWLIRRWSVSHVLSAGLAVAGIVVDRKMLADVAVKDPAGFKSLVEQAQSAVAKAA